MKKNTENNRAESGRAENGKIEGKNDNGTKNGKVTEEKLKNIMTQEEKQNEELKNIITQEKNQGEGLKNGMTQGKNQGEGLKNGMTQEEYQEYVKQITPVNNTFADVVRAFIVGGIICVLGQIISNWLTGNMSLEKEDAAAWTSIILVAASVILTGFNLYSKLVKWGGAGALVPITGFANSVASPAIEAQTEGQVFGIGCSIFKIAGPVILYGVFTSWILGILYWILRMWGIA